VQQAGSQQVRKDGSGHRRIASSSKLLVSSRGSIVLAHSQKSSGHVDSSLFLWPCFCQLVHTVQQVAGSQRYNLTTEAGEGTSMSSGQVGVSQPSNQTLPAFSPATIPAPKVALASATPATMTREYARSPDRTH
jgi:hypothetical protein